MSQLINRDSNRKQLLTSVALAAVFPVLWVLADRATATDQSGKTPRSMTRPTINAGAVAPLSNPIEDLGRRIFFDTNLSNPPGTACASCHDPARAFAGDNGSGLGVAQGARDGETGFRKAPTLNYLAGASAFSWVDTPDGPVPVGGLFWDGRANSFEEQARGPLFAPHEMNNQDEAALATRARAASWAGDLTRLFGPTTLDDPASAVTAMTTALGAFQRSAVFAPFTSKFDAVKRGQAKFTEQEERGLTLFSIGQKGNCHECHVVDLDSANPADSLFTNFRYHALGVPRNPRLPATAAQDYFDLGLCEPLRARGQPAEPDRYCGFFRVPTLRNIALTAPYMHNGHFDSLRDAVAFYATRDTNPELWYPDADKFNDLPASMRTNVDLQQRPYHRKLGKRPALKDAEVDDIVAFLHTLTDGWDGSAVSGAKSE